MLMEHAVDGATAGAVISRDRSQAVAVLPIAQDGFAVEIERRPSDATSFEARPAHAAADALDDEGPFQLGDRADDDGDGAAQWAAGVEVLAEADELDAEAIHLVEDFEQVPRRPGDTIATPDQQDVEAAAAGILHELIETRPAGLHTGDLVRVLLEDSVATLSCHLAEIAHLAQRALIVRAYPRIDGSAFHSSPQAPAPSFAR